MIIEQGLVIDGKYEMLGSIGSGGHGSVYKAHHVQLERFVAIKILNHGSESLELRFKREAEILHAMKHRNLALFYGFGEVMGLPYMALEYVEGVSLQKELQNLSGPAGVIRSVELAKQIAAGMACVHSHGIVHRDLKPGNILLSRASDGTDLIKLIDFGLAALLPESSFPSAQNLTKAGQAVGTAYYMSPEQCFGQKVDARSDVYALGCVLYELLTGYPPFAADSEFEIMRQHTEAAPPALAGDLGLSTSRTAELQNIVHTCLAKDPAQRYGSMNDVISALEQFSLCIGNELPRKTHGTGANVLSEPCSKSAENPQKRKSFIGKNCRWICLATLVITCIIALAVRTPWGSAKLAEIAMVVIEMVPPKYEPDAPASLRWCLDATKGDAASHKDLLLRIYKVCKKCNAPVSFRYEVTKELDKCMLTASEKRKLYIEMSPAMGYEASHTYDSQKLVPILLRQIEYLKSHSGDKQDLADASAHLFDVYQDMSDRQRAADWLTKVEQYSTAEPAIAKIRHHNAKAWLCETGHNHAEAVAHRQLALKLIPKIPYLDDEATMYVRQLMNGCLDNLTWPERLSIRPLLGPALATIRAFQEPHGQRRWMLYSLLQAKMLRLMNRPLDAAVVLEKPAPKADSTNQITTAESNEYRAELYKLTKDLEARDHFGRTDALFTRADLPPELSFPMKSEYACLQESKHHFVEAQQAREKALKEWKPELYPHTTEALGNLFTHIGTIYNTDPLPQYTLCVDATGHRLLSTDEGRAHTIAKLGLDLFGQPMPASSIAASMKEREYGYSECEIAGHLAAQRVLGSRSSPDTQIGQLYKLLYKRPPTAGERQAGVAYLASGVSLSAIAEKLAKTMEYKRRWIFGFYKRYAHDNPSAKEASFWFNQPNPENLSAIGAGFAVSCESFSNLHWDKTKLIERLYTQVLGRAPTAAEVARAVKDCDANEAVLKASN